MCGSGDARSCFDETPRSRPRRMACTGIRAGKRRGAVVRVSRRAARFKLARSVSHRSGEYGVSSVTRISRRARQLDSSHIYHDHTKPPPQPYRSGFTYEPQHLTSPTTQNTLLIRSRTTPTRATRERGSRRTGGRERVLLHRSHRQPPSLKEIVRTSIAPEREITEGLQRAGGASKLQQQTGRERPVYGFLLRGPRTVPACRRHILQAKICNEKVAPRHA